MSTLNDLGGIKSTDEQGIPQFYFMASGGTEKSLLKTVGAREHGEHTAVYILAHPEFNSLPASLEALARLQMDGVPGEIIYFKNADDLESRSRILKLCESHHKP